VSQRHYRLCKTLIGEMAKKCRARGVRFVLGVVNSPACLPDVEAEYRRVDPTFDPGYFDRDLAEFADSLGVPSLGLERVLRESYETTGVAPFWDHGHWNHQGHRVVAEALVEKLGAVLSADGEAD
jgi:hypothetical protein